MSLLSKVSIVVAVVLIIIGFRFVTQAGQGMGNVQNDGFAGTGGILILAGGLILGRNLGEYFSRKKK